MSRDKQLAVNCGCGWSMTSINASLSDDELWNYYHLHYDLAHPTRNGYGLYSTTDSQTLTNKGVEKSLPLPTPKRRVSTQGRTRKTPQTEAEWEAWRKKQKA